MAELPNNPEKDVAVIITDMEKYSEKTADMSPEEIRDFIISYHEKLKTIYLMGSNMADDFEPIAGDATVAIFEQKEGEGKHEKCIRALKSALKIAMFVEKKEIAPTRIGIFSGSIIEATFGDSSLKFGNSFSAASRLEELCSYFGTRILMDNRIANDQTDEKAFVLSIGKLTPKHFKHPIHVYSIYKPGIHNCPDDIEIEKLIDFIQTKNKAMEYFSGNALKKIDPNFPKAEELLKQAMTRFQLLTGTIDGATQRIIDYIQEHPMPTPDFVSVGMRIEDKKGETFGVRLLHLSQELFKAFDYDFYQALVIDTKWERDITLEWKSKGETIITIGEEPDGVYYIEQGKVDVLDGESRLITTLDSGSVFGEMAYFSIEGKRNATVVAKDDLVIRKFPQQLVEDNPVIHRIFQTIAKRRSP